MIKICDVQQLPVCSWLLTQLHYIIACCYALMEINVHSRSLQVLIYDVEEPGVPDGTFRKLLMSYIHLVKSLL